MRNEDTFVVMSIVFFIAIIVGIFALFAHIDNERSIYCPAHFGKDYYYVNGNRGASFCANPQGEVRYPQGW